MRCLEYCAGLGLGDWLLASGCVYQTVWNHLTGRAPDYGVKDYDLFYFDADVSYEAEDRVITRIARTAPEPFARLIEARNQARVHLWFEGRFGETYAPLSSASDALSRFVCPAFAVGIALAPSGEIIVRAPFGLEDCFAMRLRPNPSRPGPSERFARVAEGLRARWPELEVPG